MSDLRKKKLRLGELLVEKAIITEEQLSQALAEQKRSGRKLGRVLTDLNLVREEKLHEVLAQSLQIPFIDVRQLTLDQAVVRLLPEVQARRFRALVLQSDARGLLIGMADPTDLVAYDDLANRLKQPLRVALTMTRGRKRKMCAIALWPESRSHGWLVNCRPPHRKPTVA